MNYGGSALNRQLKRLFNSPWPAAVMVTVITLGTAGTIILVATPAGCRAGLHLAGSKCQAQSPLAVFPGATPTAGPTSTAVPTSGQFTSPSPYEPPASNSYPTPTPPYNSNPNVPHDPSLPPYQFDVGSGSYPPAYPEVTSGFASPTSFSCRLPIYANGPGSGGFIVFPDRTFVGDPRSGVTVPTPPGSSPPPGPYGQAFFGLSYDRAVSKWVPVQRTWVTPDGKRYAYPDNSDGIDVVDVVANTEVKVGTGIRWQVIGVEAEGIYASQSNVAGLWLVPFTGAVSKITAEGYWNAVGGGAAYGTETSSLPNGVPTVIIRLDLKSHAKQNWFEVNNSTSSVYGFDGAGHPIMMVQGFGQYPGQLWLVTGLGNALVIASNNNFSGPPIADQHGLWFMNYQATYLWVPGAGMQVQANIGGYLAGGCV
jgi:hypothetical protein